MTHALLIARPLVANSRGDLTMGRIRMSAAVTVGFGCGGFVFRLWCRRRNLFFLFGAEVALIEFDALGRPGIEQTAFESGVFKRTRVQFGWIDSFGFFFSAFGRPRNERVDDIFGRVMTAVA